MRIRRRESKTETKINPLTEVAIGMTDGSRHIGVAPPLTRDELSKILKLDIGLEGIDIHQVNNSERPATLIRTSGVNEWITPEKRTEHAQEVALQIADLLRQTREGQVHHSLEPVEMVGFNSTPFDPNNGSFRHWQ